MIINIVAGILTLVYIFRHIIGCILIVAFIKRLPRILQDLRLETDGHTYGHNCKEYRRIQKQIIKEKKRLAKIQGKLYR